MKTPSFILMAAFSLALSLAPARAEEPAPLNLTPELQAMLAELLKGAEPAAAEAAPVPAPAVPNAPVAIVPAPKPPLGSASGLKTSRLTTSALTAGSLAPSSLNGRGATGLGPRLNHEDWRLLFPVVANRR